MADAAYRVVTSCNRTHFFLDSDILLGMKVRDRSAWQVDPTAEYAKLYDDFMVEPLGFSAGQSVEYLPLPQDDKGLSWLSGKHVLLVGTSSVTSSMPTTWSTADGQLTG